NLHSLYQIMSLYANDYHGYWLPARLKENVGTSATTFYWWSAGLIGNELRQNDPTAANLNAQEQVIAKYLQCPAAQDDLDTNGKSAGTHYWGDYTYNSNMGDMDYSVSPATGNCPYWKQTQIPGNVLIMADNNKAARIIMGQTPDGGSMFANVTYLVGSH